MTEQEDRRQFVTTYEKKTKKLRHKRVSDKTALALMLERGTITQEQFWVGEEFARNWEMAHKPLGPKTMNLEAVRVQTSRKAMDFSDAQMQAQQYVRDALRGKTKAEAYLMREVCGGDRSVTSLAGKNALRVGIYTTTLQYALTTEVKRWKQIVKFRKYIEKKKLLLKK